MTGRTFFVFKEAEFCKFKQHRRALTCTQSASWGSGTQDARSSAPALTPLCSAPFFFPTSSPPSHLQSDTETKCYQKLWRGKKYTCHWKSIMSSFMFVHRHTNTQTPSTFIVEFSQLNLQFFPAAFHSLQRVLVFLVAAVHLFHLSLFGL